MSRRLQNENVRCCNVMFAMLKLVGCRKENVDVVEGR